jgi:hypothetical protein
MKEYYKIILHPVSLNSLKKHVKPPSGVSEFKSWKVFEEEVAALWQNAWHFNMDGSDIYTAATELKVSHSELILPNIRLTCICRNSLKSDSH